MDAEIHIDIKRKDILPIIRNIVKDIPWLEGDVVIGNYIENTVLKLLRDRSSSQALYDLYMFLVETKSASESLSDILLELIAWAFISKKNKEPFLYFCRSSLLVHNKLLDVFAKKIIGLDYNSCSQRIDELCEDLDLDRAYIYVQYFKSIKSSQPAKISLFLDKLNNPIKYEILRAAFESGDEQIILKIDDYLSFCHEYKGYIFDYIYDGNDLLDEYIKLDNSFIFKVTNFKNLVLKKNKECGHLKTSIDRLIIKCKDFGNLDFLEEIASAGEVKKVFKVICETQDKDNITRFLDKFKDDPYIKSLSVYT